MCYIHTVRHSHKSRCHSFSSQSAHTITSNSGISKCFNLISHRAK
nr:MAG TPA: hypothetical protein [Caudoviricetes sp.]